MAWQMTCDEAFILELYISGVVFAYIDGDYMVKESDKLIGSINSFSVKGYGATQL